MRSLLLGLLASILACLAGGRARAHGSTPPTPATFTNPPRLERAIADGGREAFAAYPFPVADHTFELRWEDSDDDGIARHTFYYLDHAPPLVVAVGDLPRLAMPIVEAGEGIWASCTCLEDLGACPDAGQRRCENSLT